MSTRPIVSRNSQIEWDDADRICVVSIARRVAGEEAAALIQGHFGGTSIFVPSSMPRDNQLSQLIGWEAARAVASHAGGLTCHVTRGEFRPDLIVREIVLWGKMAGLFDRAIANLAGISDRHVRTVATSLRTAGILPPKPRKK